MLSVDNYDIHYFEYNSNKTDTNIDISLIIDIILKNINIYTIESKRTQFKLLFNLFKTQDRTSYIQDKLLHLASDLDKYCNMYLDKIKIKTN